MSNKPVLIGLIWSLWKGQTFSSSTHFFLWLWSFGKSLIKPPQIDGYFWNLYQPANANSLNLPDLICRTKLSPGSSLDLNICWKIILVQHCWINKKFAKSANLVLPLNRKIIWVKRFVIWTFHCGLLLISQFIQFAFVARRLRSAFESDYYDKFWLIF